MPRKKKIDEKEIENEYILYTILLSVISILYVSLRNYTIDVGKSAITVSVFIFPIVLFVSNYLTKKFSLKRSFLSIVISCLFIILFLILMSDLLYKKFNMLETFSIIIPYFVSLFINIYLYYYIVTNIDEKSMGILIYISYLFSIIINSLLYMLFVAGFSVGDRFWLSLIISVLFGGCFSIIAAIFDNKIRRGI